MRTALLVSVLLLALGASDVLAKSKPTKHKKPTKDPKDSNKRVFAIFGGLRHPRCARWRKTYIECCALEAVVDVLLYQPSCRPRSSPLYHRAALSQCICCSSIAVATPAALRI